MSHKWRSEEDAILVATNTVKYDNPTLTTRDWAGKSPIRLFIDKDLKINKLANILDNSVLTLCYNQKESTIEQNNESVKLDFNQDILPQIMNDLYTRKLQSVIVEGGSALLNSFITSNLWDEARIFTAQNTYFDKGIAAPILNSRLIKEQTVDNDTLRYLFNKSALNF
jgi:diaminohydroxyphosphoribosylaminopyrimidine deaminase/5-amino-6-(5-phosphoribosylamino)uracil reductase